MQLYRSPWENNTQLPYSMSSVSTFLTSLWVQSLKHEFYFVVILWSNSVVTLWSLLESGRRIKHPFITRLVKSGFKKLMTSKIFCLTLQNLKLFTISLFEFCIPTQKNQNPIWKPTCRSRDSGVCRSNSKTAIPGQEWTQSTCSEHLLPGRYGCMLKSCKDI